MFFFGGAYFGVLYYLPIYFQSVYNTSPIGSGVRMLALIIPLTLAAIVQGIALSKIGIVGSSQAVKRKAANVLKGASLLDYRWCFGCGWLWALLHYESIHVYWQMDRISDHCRLHKWLDISGSTFECSSTCHTRRHVTSVSHHQL